MPRDRGDLRMRLGTELVGARWHHYEELDSTNLEALRLAELGAPVGTVIVADTQTAGRGRLGHGWSDSPGGCLLMSALLDPPEQGPGLVTATAALAAAEAIGSATALVPTIKWPNDLMLGDRKLGGVLAEGRANHPFAVGIGVNVNGTAEDLPPDLRDRAIFISSEAGHTIDLAILAEELAVRLDRRYHLLMTGRERELVEAISARDYLAGRRVGARMGAATLEGESAGWLPDGRLALLLDDGSQIALDAAEVTLL